MRIWDIEFGMYSHEIYHLGGLSLSMEIIMLILVMNRGYSGISNQLGMIVGVIIKHMDIGACMGFMGIFHQEHFPHVNG